MPAVMQIVSSGGFYGAERVMLELAQLVASQGWRSCVAALPSPGASELLRRAREVGVQARLIEPSPHRPWSVCSALRAALREEGIHILHSHGYKSDIIGAIASPQGVARVATCHTWYSETPKLMLYEAWDLAALHSFDQVVVVSPELLQRVRRFGIRRSLLIDNGVEPSSGAGDLRELRQQLGVAEGARLVLGVGRLAPSKGFDLLLQAVARLSDAVPDLQLVLAGEGDQRGALEQQADRLGVRVSFAGYCREMPTLLAAAELLVISSRKEGLPMVLLEAMSARLPVVSTAVGAIPQLLGEGAGWLVPADDPAALATAISEALGDEKASSARAAEAHRRYLERHSREAMGRRYLSLYRGLLGRC